MSANKDRFCPLHYRNLITLEKLSQFCHSVESSESLGMGNLYFRIIFSTKVRLGSEKLVINII